MGQAPSNEAAAALILVYPESPGPRMTDSSG